MRGQPLLVSSPCPGGLGREPQRTRLAQEPVRDSLLADTRTSYSRAVQGGLRSPCQCRTPNQRKLLLQVACASFWPSSPSPWLKTCLYTLHLHILGKLLFSILIPFSKPMRCCISPSQPGRSRCHLLGNFTPLWSQGGSALAEERCLVTWVCRMPLPFACHLHHI